MLLVRMGRYGTVVEAIPPGSFRIYLTKQFEKPDKNWTQAF